jgi:hypothetical protein
MSDVSDDLMTVTVRRHARRLSDKILIAFHRACDQRDFEVAGRLLNILETMTAALHLSRAPRGSERPRRQETLVAAHERLWQLRHPHLKEG